VGRDAGGGVDLGIRGEGKNASFIGNKEVGDVRGDWLGAIKKGNGSPRRLFR